MNSSLFQPDDIVQFITLLLAYMLSSPASIDSIVAI